MHETDSFGIIIPPHGRLRACEDGRSPTKKSTEQSRVRALLFHRCRKGVSEK